MAFIMHISGLFILVAASEMLNGIARLPEAMSKPCATHGSVA